MLKTWQFVQTSLEAKLKLVLLYVVESTGSSPGRKGFAMAVNEQGIFRGTIGGGIMEVKLIELAKNMLKQPHPFPLVKKQFHDKRHPRNQSGLICSGEQTVVLMPMDARHQSLITPFIKGDRFWIQLSSEGITTISTAEEEIGITSEQDFQIKLQVPDLPRTLIFGGGHVGTALARQMDFLGHRTIIYDDRENVITLETEHWSGASQIINYSNLTEQVDFRSTDAIVMVTFSYRTDKLILKQLYRLPFAYIGMMGSEQKIATLKQELGKEGIESAQLQHVFFPIGVNIFSKTAEEIAVSIAAQIIREKNRHLPTGRTYTV